MYTLAIADPAYSSWSLRGWLLLTRFGLSASLETGRLYTSQLSEVLEPYAPARTVPALRISQQGPEGNRESGREIIVWDSLAIAETLAERHPAAGHWPADPVARGLARSVVAEMHSGFQALRAQCPMNLRRAYVGFDPTPEVLADLRRIEALWQAARASAGGDGPWLFGDYSAADAFFAPVAARVATYDLPVGAEAAAYVTAQLGESGFLDWRARALADPIEQDRYDLALPEVPWRGPLA